MRKIELKQKATKAFFAILFFICSYCILFLSAIGLTLVGGYAGILLIALKPAFYTLMIGLGMIGMGGLLLFFLVKFLFKRNKIDRSRMVEIFEKDEPRLFALVRGLSNEIKTSFPKRIYLSSDVNASVFYDSGFWSMFVPTRKNLQIGLGLVNSVTESELKAILAHEFGHFSQKSMRFGSYVYHVNHVIYDLLKDDASFDSIVQQWASVNSYFSFFASMALRIVNGIRWILVKLYALVNLSYLELSREMEFEADEIAASVVGSAPLVDSLLRLSIADSAMDGTLGFYGKKISENKRTQNIYPDHRWVMENLALHYKLPMQHHLPYISEEAANKFHRSQLVIKDQWSSHPSTNERVARLNSLGYTADLHNGPAWNYFSDQEHIQKKLTDHLFEHVAYSEEPQNLTLQEFATLYLEEENKHVFDRRYQRFYEERRISKFDWKETVMASQTSEPRQIEEVFNEESTELLFTEKALQGDISLLEQIAYKQLDVKSFDFAGQRYLPKQALGLLEQVKNQLRNVEEKLDQVDQTAFRFFYRKASSLGKEKELTDLYNAYFHYLDQFWKDHTLYNELAVSVQFTQHTQEIKEIKKKITKVYELEATFKPRLASILSDPQVKEQLNEQMKEELDAYFSQEWTYFVDSAYNNVAIDYLFGAMQFFLDHMNQGFYDQQRTVLQGQMDLLDAAERHIAPFSIEKTV